MREVDDLWGGADDGLDVFPFDFFSFAESALEVLHLSLRKSSKSEIKGDGSTNKFPPYPEPRYLVPLNRVLALSNDGRFRGYRAPLDPPLTLYRIIRRE